MKGKRSFFEKLTGAVKVDDFEDEYEDEYYDDRDQNRIPTSYRDDERSEYPAQSQSNPISAETDEYEEDRLPEEEGQLSVDVINTPDDIVIKALVSGVKPQDLDVQISRDMVTIHGSRENDHEEETEDYYHRELYWGSFSRNIILPEEVDVELAEAKEKHGLLIIKLPKIDKKRKTKLQVKSS